MKANNEKTHQPQARVSRADGQITRQDILEKAGKIFAEFGYASATSKQVCHASRVNLAAVNYHFGSKEGLYAAVLAEAHRRLISLENLSAIAIGDEDASIKIGRVIDALIDSTDAGGWHLKVYLREMIAPSTIYRDLLESQIFPKLNILKIMLHEITGIQIDDPALERCFFTTFTPCTVLLIANKEALNHGLPGVWGDRNALKNHLKTFALAGCKSVAKSTM